jgi:hypothetical protein
MVGGWQCPKSIGEVDDIYDRGPDGIVHHAPARIMAVATREEYLAQQRDRGYLEYELANPDSIANQATHFYHFHTD